ncbi:MAG TPA: three-Cys-motif partner protein TcmP [Thermoanaerobaculia bacterium]|jgi:three-Cys-motif partner protein|nr:three-Cys-motif partner protein TcmP [Thermoanaerobaculia bacterium]
MVRFDEIGYWSELKLEILEKYAKPYSQILSNAREPRLHHVYIDGFSGAGTHLSKETGERIPGSPLRALEINPPFREYFFVDLNSSKVEELRRTVGTQPNVHIYEGDCNRTLLAEVFPKVRYEDYRRGLCLLDPYGLHLDWQVIKTAAELRSIEIFLNFPVLDMNRNVLWRNPHGATPEQRQRMTSFWGNDSWYDAAYQPPGQGVLFGEREPEKQGNEVIAEAFRKRLLDVAGFKHVPKPLAMRNSTHAVVYYLFFACHRPVANKIVEEIFKKYRER